VNECVNNLRHIDSVIQQWALEQKVPDTNSCSLTNEQILSYFQRKTLPICPEGGTYTAGRTLTNWPECSIHGNPDTASSISGRRVREEKQKGNRGTVSVLIAGAVCLVAALVFRRQRVRSNSLIH